MENTDTADAEIVAGLRSIGYLGSLLEENYGLGTGSLQAVGKTVKIAAAAFGQMPVAYSTRR